MTTPPPVRLHKKQVALLAFVDEFQTEHGHPPIYDAIAKAIGLKSTSGVGYHIMQLQVLGYVTMEPSHPRTLVLTEKATTALPPLADTKRSRSAWVRIVALFHWWTRPIRRHHEPRKT